MMLQMIAEMERLILKADPLPRKDKNHPHRSSAAATLASTSNIIALGGGSGGVGSTPKPSRKDWMSPRPPAGTAPASNRKSLASSRSMGNVLHGSNATPGATPSARNAAVPASHTERRDERKKEGGGSGSGVARPEIDVALRRERSGGEESVSSPPAPSIYSFPDDRILTPMPSQEGEEGLGRDHEKEVGREPSSDSAPPEGDTRSPLRPQLSRSTTLPLDGLIQAYQRLEESADRMGLTSGSGTASSSDWSALKVHVHSPMAIRTSPPQTLRRTYSAKRVLFDPSVESGSTGEGLVGEGPVSPIPEDEGVLVSVSTMLTMLKDFIAKHSGNRPGGSTHDESVEGAGEKEAAAGSGLRLSPGSGTSASMAETANSASTSSPLATLQTGVGDLLIPGTPAMVSRAAYEQLKMDLKLKDADNRFLQEELDKKDKMLALLTEGLKEVRTCECIGVFFWEKRAFWCG